MDEIILDRRDRSNLYKEEPDNVLAHEATVTEVRDDLDMDEVYERFDEAQAKVFGGNEDVVYLVFKITKG